MGKGGTYVNLKSLCDPSELNLAMLAMFICKSVHLWFWNNKINAYFKELTFTFFFMQIGQKRKVLTFYLKIIESEPFEKRNL